MRVLVRQLRRGDGGQNLIEYSLLLAILTVGSLAFVKSSNGSVSSIWTTTNLSLQGQTTSQSGSSTNGTTSGGSSGTSGNQFADHHDH